MPIGAYLPVSVHLDQLDHLILFALDVGVQLLDAYPDVVFGVGEVLVGGSVV